MTSDESFLRPKKSAFWTTILAAASAACVNFQSMQTSPAAKMRGFVVRRRSSTFTPAARVELDARALEAEALDVRRPADADQDLVDGERLVPRSHAQTCSTFSSPLRSTFRRLAPSTQLDAVARERPLHDLRGVGVLAREDAAAAISSRRHPRAEALEGLGQLAADRTGADHGEPRGPLGQLEDGLVREVAGLREPRDRRRGGAGAGRDHRLLEAQLRAVHLDGVRPAEARLAEEHVDAELVAIARRRVLVADARADAAHALHGRAEVGQPLVGHAEPELPGRPRLVHPARRADHGLRRHAADVQAVAAHQVPLDERDPGARLAAPATLTRPGGSGADHDEVVAARGRRVHPVGGVDVRDERFVVRVVRQDVDRLGHWQGSEGPVGPDGRSKRPALRARRLRSARRATRVTRIVTIAVAAKPSPTTA